MTKIQNSKQPRQYDLETRTLQFAKDTRSFVKLLRKTLANIEDGKQLTRSSGSVGANYIEANEALSKKDFLVRIKICRKEAKESIYWLMLVEILNNPSLEKERERLINEATELMKIFSPPSRNPRLFKPRMKRSVFFASADFSSDEATDEESEGF